MEGLTIEQKAAAYDRALDVLHKYDGANIMFSQSLKEEMFPELKKESEDEKIKKLLVEAVIQVLQDQYCSNRGVPKERVVAWIERQGEKKPADSYCRKNCRGFQETGKCFADGDCEAKREAESADKAESKHVPKFHNGDWVIGKATENKPRQIAEITEEGYKSTYGGWYGFSFEEDMHLWSVRDARAGDILSDGTVVFIFEDLMSDGSVMSYCDYDPNSGESDAFCPFPMNLGCLKITPASKEQRDTLMKAMAGAGYTFDFDRKELKKAEPAGWGEEDDYNVQCLIAKATSDIQAGNAGRNQELIDWLKFLKYRITSKLSGE